MIKRLLKFYKIVYYLVINLFSILKVSTSLTALPLKHTKGELVGEYKIS